jgi:hypothetical protein
MYLRELFIKNGGPLRELQIDFAFTPEDRPIPHLIVGRNGTGKTNLLSIIADALIRAASTAFTDVVTPYGGSGQSYFRIVGGTALTYRERGGFSILRFTESADEYFYAENTGYFSPEDARGLVPDSLKSAANWNANDQGKRFTIPREKVREIFQKGAYVYFPSSRAEYPSWLNRESLIEDTYDLGDRFSTTLNKPIFVERGIDKFAQWLLGLITDSRLEVSLAPDPNDSSKMAVKFDGPYDPRAIQTLEVANSALRMIMNDSDAHFYWGGRHDMRKVGVASGSEPRAAGLDSLSGGQASLLAIFGTLLRYADPGPREPALTPESIQGLVVIDELDAHMHIDLQMTALPKLISLFPRVQFIVSSQSPFFALGMEKNFPNDAVRIIDLPTGLAVNAEAYDEFGHALGALMETQAFEKKIGEFLAAAEQPVVFVAGETDVPYFKTGAKLLGYPHLEPYFQWIGTPGQSGGGSHTGDDALKSTVKFLRANPGFTGRKVVVVYDNDANQSDDHFDSVHIIALPKIDGAFVEDGIENMLPAHVFTDDVIEEKVKPSGISGKPKILPEVRKTLLSGRLCGDDADPTNFQHFAPILERINNFITAGSAGVNDENGVSSTESGTA